MSLVALVLGAVGVAMAMRAHLAQRLDTIAIMKSLGASSGQIIKIYLLQTLLLGLAGGLLGVMLGVGVQLAFPYLLASLINVRPDLHLDPRAILAGLGAGVLTTLLFTLPPLLDIRSVRPILILRRAMEDVEEPVEQSAGHRLRSNLPQIAAVFVTLVLAATLLHALHIGTYGLNRKGFIADAFFAVFALAAGYFMPPFQQIFRRLRKNLAQIFAFSSSSAAFRSSPPASPIRRGRQVLLGRPRRRAVRAAPRLVRRAAPPELLPRPHPPAPCPLPCATASRTSIVPAILPPRCSPRSAWASCRSCWSSSCSMPSSSSCTSSSAPNLPNVFLVDIANAEIGGMRDAPHALARGHRAAGTPARRHLPRRLRSTASPAADIKLKNFPHRMLQSIQLTYDEASRPAPRSWKASGGPPRKLPRQTNIRWSPSPSARPDASA